MAGLLSENYLQISLPDTGLSVTLDLFMSDESPRIDPQQAGSVEYTATGSVIVKGRSYELKSLWNVQAYLYEIEGDFQSHELLMWLWNQSDTRRRNPTTPGDTSYQLLVYDTTYPIFEPLPITRAIVPETVVGYYPSDAAPTHVKYYAQFYAFIPERPVIRHQGDKFSVTFTMYELDKVTP